MIIISKDKKEIINFDKVEEIWIKGNEVKFIANHDHIYTAMYNIEERAKEVLDLIISHYNSDKKVCYLPEE